MSCLVSSIFLLFSNLSSGDTLAPLADVPTVVVAAGAAVPSLASPLAAWPSSVDACIAADSDWRSVAGTLL